jgi:hypothetical protein
MVYSKNHLANGMLDKYPKFKRSAEPRQDCGDPMRKSSRFDFFNDVGRMRTKEKL